MRAGADTFNEYVWNEVSAATGGGISDFFDLPAYQHHAGVPPSINDNARVGRGVPDVAANSSGASGYGMYADGAAFIGYGTSAAAPLYAGLIAVLNAALGRNVGFLNPKLYATSGKPCRSVEGPPGPADNGILLTKGYPAQGKWNACTGWGTIDGQALLACLQDANKV
jgi:kumamolisin